MKQQETGISSIINTIRKAKYIRAGHIAWLSDNHWTIRPTEWTPRNWTRKQGHPVWTGMVKCSQAQTRVGSIQGGVPLSRVNTNPDDDDGDKRDAVF